MKTSDLPASQGPAEITVFHPDVFSVTDGPRSECIKSEWYDLLYPFLSLVSARDKSIHAGRRREWTRCFTSKEKNLTIPPPLALTQHEDKIIKQIDELDQLIENNVLFNKHSEMRNLCFWFGFNAMRPLIPASWLVQLGLRLGPRIWVIRDWHETTSPDLTHYLMEQEGEISYKDSLYWMHGDSLLAIVAGSEPTAYIILAIFCELAKHPHHAENIYEELDGIDVTDLKKLNWASHLNAVINETLRLYPALLTSSARKTTKEGVMIGGVYIPPETTIVSPRFSIQRREDCFEQANSFIPERWTTRPEMIHNLAAFNPFSTGHHSCLGRQLAMDTMKLLMARIVKKYRFRLAPGETGTRVFGEMVDQFTANPGNLSLVFEMR
ncbi:hypothetical protein ABKA04_009945 [Annulohypoxylon sp. FPYF3050]